MPGLQVSTQQLEYLVAIAGADTWADAAADAGVSPSALSQGIAELERRLGIALFERDGRRRVPTRDHADVLRYAEATVAATRDLDRWLAHRRAGTAGLLRLGMIDAAATHHLRDALLGYRRDRREVELRLTVGPSSALLAGLRRADLDLVVCVEPETPIESVACVPLFDDPLAVLAPAGEGHAHRRQWGPWVTFPQGSHTRRLIADRLQQVGAPFEVVAESHQPEVLREMVRLGIGWAVLPLAGLEPVTDLDVVDPVLVQRRLVLARRTSSARNAALDELADVLTRAGRACSEGDR